MGDESQPLPMPGAVARRSPRSSHPAARWGPQEAGEQAVRFLGWTLQVRFPPDEAERKPSEPPYVPRRSRVSAVSMSACARFCVHLRVWQMWSFRPGQMGCQMPGRRGAPSAPLTPIRPEGADMKASNGSATRRTASTGGTMKLKSGSDTFLHPRGVHLSSDRCKRAPAEYCGLLEISHWLVREPDLVRG